MIKVLIAGDHPVFRIGLKNMIEQNTDMIVAGEASDGDEALNKALENDFDSISTNEC